MENELTEREQAAVKLSNSHWAYIRQVLYHDCVDEGDIERIGFHYKSAFVHGFKHAEQGDARVPESNKGEGYEIWKDERGL